MEESELELEFGMQNTMEHLLQEGKGILAADESNGTIGARFTAIGLENTKDNRINYRLLLATTEGLDQYINGVILFAETLYEKDDKGVSIVENFTKQGIISGIKLDKGLVKLANSIDEKITIGLDDLTERLLSFKKEGIKFAKWRNVYTISESTPSLMAIQAGAEVLARYAACCQAVGIVPIVEPEVLMDGNHSIDDCFLASERVLQELFCALYRHQVVLEHMILKPNMITCGKSFIPFSLAEEVANATISLFRNVVPAAVPTINFLSGGQSPKEATMNLNAMNILGIHPWNLSFSYGRALQEDCLKEWKGESSNIQKAQKVLLKRAKLNSLACLGQYQEDMEHSL